jgi:hypothetical protein
LLKKIFFNETHIKRGFIQPEKAASKIAIVVWSGLSALILFVA